MNIQQQVIETRRLQLVPKTRDRVRAQIEAMSNEQRAQLSSDWLAQFDWPGVDVWTLGFDIVERTTGDSVGGCGFKGPPGTEGIVEIAYGLEPSHQGKGFATEAAEALVSFAFASGQVRTVRAHTLSATNASARVLTKCGFRGVGQVIDPDDGLVSRWEIDATERRPS